LTYNEVFLLFFYVKEKYINMLKKEEKTHANGSGTKLEKIIEKMNDCFGKGSVVTLGGDPASNQRNILSTGSMILDDAIGGGYVFGRMVEIYGQESSGKTTLALHAVSECQKLGKIAAYIDLENCLDSKYAKQIGVDNEKLLIVYPKHGEEALDCVVELIENDVNLIVVDSVAALIPKAELEADLEKQTIGLRARMMSSALVKINKALTGKNAMVIFINQIRNKVSTGYFSGNPETTSGGVALSYFASLRMRMREKEKIEKGMEYVGIKAHIRVKKNKLASPYREPIIEIFFGKGISKDRELIDMAVEKNIVSKSGG
jgi:recombination protein RecA